MKKNFKKIFAVALSAAFVAAAFVGCGSDKKADSNKWVVGTNAEFAPFEFVSSSNGVIDQYSGIDMEIIKQIAEDNGKEVEINNMEFDSLTVALKNGQLDAVIAGMTVTDERKEAVDFSDPYYVAKQVMIVPEDSTIAKASDMEGKTIAVVQGYTGEVAVQELGYQYEAFKKGTEAILELTNGKCDVVVIDSATANQYVKDNAGLKIVEDNDAFESEEYAIAVKKGDTETLELINASIKKMKEDGTIDAISAKYADMSAEDDTASDGTASDSSAQ
ncbi:MAG: basic amino acid ABC transporter substrate-binding protein [Lachnospiraceae bacterium]|nr:basic amino acid ABC transporter substrate-binding protein [Lachnospiraceae bacterium]